ncbi:MAG TPA: AIR carboxylase family protein [Candidatus Dormibacteraeota bacterium]|nr:AIR carboxylase family protein [Candidatus Dormibacteraeota bacterium]
MFARRVFLPFLFLDNLEGNLFQVCIVMGSKSDLDLVRSSGMTDILDRVFEGSSYEYSVSVCSAHRNLMALEDFARGACQDGAKVFIGIAGMAAALPGALAGCTLMAKPVIAVPLDEHGIDSCIYMPPGVPVLTAGVGKPGLKNAAIAACQILAIGDHDLELSLMRYISKNNKQAEFNIDLKES